MKINNQHYKTIWFEENTVKTFDQRKMPFEVEIVSLNSVEAIYWAIKEMIVRGAPLIGATAAWGMYWAVKEAIGASDFNAKIFEFASKLKSARPTAVDLFKAIDQQLREIAKVENENLKLGVAKETAELISSESVFQCRSIGEHGLRIIQDISKKKNGEPVNILTHCNAGWLATVDYGTATAPIYLAQEKGIEIHVWVDETRPRNQGASLTAFELSEQNVAHTLIVDNAGGHLMQHGLVDIVIVGTDRTTRNGDVANKIGTYLKALAAFDNNIPFYVAAPSSSIDFNISDGLKEIQIEERNADEVKYISGKLKNEIEKVLICPENTKAKNFGFDVTPAKYVTGLITERGICKANEKDILRLFPEKVIMD